MTFKREFTRRHFLKAAGAAGVLSTAKPVRIAAGADEAVVWKIFVPEKAGEPLLFAARELQKYTARLGKIRCEIVRGFSTSTDPGVFLSSNQSPGPTTQKLANIEDGPATGSDSYFIKGTGGQIAIEAASDRAVLFAVYHLLERFGCQWFGPLEEDVPQLAELSMPVLEVRSEPVMIWRGLQLIAGSNPAVVDWMAKARLNVAWPEKYTPNPDLTSSPVQLKAAAVPEMIERGMTIFWGGHVLPILFSPERYADHPEYFAQIHGKRLDPTLEDVQARWQLCTSNPDVIRILIENTITFLKHHPWIEVLFLWGNDTTLWCECAACRALESQPDRKASYGGLNRSATYCRLIKLVNDGVQKELPGRRLAFNHYYNLENLPDDLSVLPDRTALSAVDVYQQCPRHALDDQNCPKGKQLKPLVRAWGSHYENTISWTYYWAWNFMKGLPFARSERIISDIRLLRSLGIRGNVDNVTLTPAQMELYDDRPGLFITEHWRYNLLDFHIYAAAMWNPDMDVNQTRSNFIARYYGPAAPAMTRFWSRLEAMIQNINRHPDFTLDAKRQTDPSEVHGWLKNVRNLIPNRRNWEDLEGDLREARHLAAKAYQQPLAARYMPYVERIQLLERAIATWECTAEEAAYPRN